MFILMIILLSSILKTISWAILIASLSTLIFSLFSPLISNILGIISALLGGFLFLLFLSLGVLIEKVDRLDASSKENK